jgi:serine protease
MLTFARVVLLMAAAVTVAAAAERNPVRRYAAAAPTGSIIVRLRSAQGVVDSVPLARQRLQALAARTGVNFSAMRSITAQMHVVQVGAGSAQLADTLARLRADPQVQYAEPDERRHLLGVPNDTLYGEQWYLMPSSASTPAAVDAQTAWNTTTGATSLVIADVDSGVLFNHPDLLSVSSGGRLLPGYCFISDPFIANNSSCPGADASDPGDWITSADLSRSECSGQTSTAYSSWHGTRVAGMLGAITNNSLGVAGITWGPMILPVRSLGVCGGMDSDIISGMLWAAGISVSGAPVNATPARIINLSLGGSGACLQSYQDAIDQITALGVLIVVAAGNEGGPVETPANCQGVAGVAGLRHAGTKVGYSNVGPGLAVGAPAGNCVNTAANQPCLNELVTTTNLGTETPGTNDYTGDYYCDPTTGSNANCQISGNEYRTYNLGTSFAAPIVSGIGALMLSVNDKLNSCQLVARIEEGALPYPQTSVGETTQPPMCHVPSGSTDIQDTECICTTDGQTCGVGMANAPGALAAALRPIAAIAVPSSGSPGQLVQLKGSGSAALTNHTLTTFAWTNAGSQAVTIQNASTATASVTLPKCGLATVMLTVTDDAGLQDSAQAILTPTSVTTSAPAVAGQACSLSSAAVLVAVCPATVSVQAGSTQSFVATLANTTNTEVSWQVNGIDGGNATLGTISSTGVYTAPAKVPTGSVTVTAVAAADSTAAGSALLTITAPAGNGGGGGGTLDGLTLFAAIAAALARRRARPRCQP